MQKVFLDTNIVIDFLGERESFYNASAKIMTLADKKKIKILTSPTSISNTYYLLSKYENAITSDFKYFEDAMQYFSALASDCDLIITRNEKDFKNALIPVMNAESYLQTLK